MTLGNFSQVEQCQIAHSQTKDTNDCIGGEVACLPSVSQIRQTETNVPLF